MGRDTVVDAHEAARSRTMFRVAAMVVVFVACGLLAAALTTRHEVCAPSNPTAPVFFVSGIYIFALLLVVLVRGAFALRGRRLPDGSWALVLGCGIAFVIVLVAVNVMPDRVVVCPR